MDWASNWAIRESSSSAIGWSWALMEPSSWSNC